MKRNFTLIELLVVIAIIAILAAMLFPALNKARESALNIKCTGLLQQFGNAEMLYQSDFAFVTPNKLYPDYQPDSNYKSSLAKWHSFYGLYLPGLFYDKEGNNNMVRDPAIGKEKGHMCYGSGLDTLIEFNPEEKTSNRSGYTRNNYGAYATNATQTPLFLKPNMIRHPSEKVNIFDGYDWVTPIRNVGSAKWLDFTVFAWRRHHGGDAVNVTFFDGHVGKLPRLYASNYQGTGVSTPNYFGNLTQN